MTSRHSEAGFAHLRGAWPRLTLLILLIAFLAAPARFEPLLAPLANAGTPAIYNQGDLWRLALSHVGMVAVATAASTVTAVGLGVLVTRPAGAAFLPLSRSLANIGQTFPPVAVLAVAVPLVGFGAAPTLIALFAYGLLPIFENTVAGLQQTPVAVLDAARGVGMSPVQRFYAVELPLAAPQIIEGVRISTVIAIGTATIGSTVAAKGLGEVIIAGLLSDNAAFVAQGAAVVSAIAVLAYDVLGAAERAALRRTGIQPDP